MIPRAIRTILSSIWDLSDARYGHPVRHPKAGKVVPTQRLSARGRREDVRQTYFEWEEQGEPAHHIGTNHVHSLRVDAQADISIQMRFKVTRKTMQCTGGRNSEC
jgi:hypothetical protein